MATPTELPTVTAKEVCERQRRAYKLGAIAYAKGQHSANGSHDCALCREIEKQAAQQFPLPR